MFRVTVGNTHYMGSHLGDFESKEAAERAIEDWLREMLAIDGETPEDYPENDHGYEWVIDQINTSHGETHEVPTADSRP